MSAASSSPVADLFIGSTGGSGGCVLSSPQPAVRVTREGQNGASFAQQILLKSPADQSPLVGPLPAAAREEGREGHEE